MKKQSRFYGLKDFLILWASQAVSTMGSAMTSHALLLWVYAQKGTATSVALLSFFSLLPSIFFCFVAGTIADRWDKKKIMLISDVVAALGTTALLVLYSVSALQIWHLYAINLLISFMNAFQSPAGYVAVSLLAPKEQYTRVSGLQAFSQSLIKIITPALATFVLAFGGLHMVFIIDLVTFAVGFCVLLFLIKIPALHTDTEREKVSFWANCREGLHFLKKNRPLLELILFFSFINLIAFISGLGGVFPAMILARSGGSQEVLGFVSAAVGIGSLVGSLLVTATRPPKHRAKVVFLSCGISFLLTDIPWALGQSVWVWAAAAFAGNMVLPFLNANLTTIMRDKVPTALQGRVFSTRDTIQYATIPVGLYVGGILADRIFEPFMTSGSPLAATFSVLVGSGKGSGMALIFLITGTIGSLSSFACLRRRSLKALD